MRINYFTHNLELTDDLKNYFEKKISKINIYKDLINKVDVYFELERYINKVEVIVDFRKGKAVYFMSVENDMYKSVDNIIDRIERTINKYKSKIVHHKEVISPKYLSFYQRNNEQEKKIVERIDLIKLYKKPLSIEDAILQLEYRKNREFIVFYNYDISNSEDFIPTIIFKTNDKNTYIAFEKINNDESKIKKYKLIGEKYNYKKVDEEEIEIKTYSLEEVLNKLREDNIFIFKDINTNELFFVFNRINNDKKGVIKVESFK